MNTFVEILLGVFSVLKVVFMILGFSLIPFIVPMIIFYIYFRFFKKIKPDKCVLKRFSYGSKLKRLFFDFPKRFVLDKLTLNPNIFREKGVHVICGEQGSGKSIALTYMLLMYKEIYPKLKIKTNYDFVHQDAPINHWKDIVFSTNGEDGEIDVLDEIQNWFNSLQSKDFPPEMMTEITQQRKQVKCIFGTAQVFSRIAKPIREQINYLYIPSTFFGCLTVVRKYKPTVSAQDGIVDSKKLKGMFFFVHSDKIRNSFDTYKKITTMSKQGYKPDIERVNNNQVVLMESISTQKK